MERLVVNRSGNTRRATLHGRNYVVVPVTMIVPGVLNGSKGPLFYPLEQVSRNASDWNGMPILLGHPEQGSGRKPEILERAGIGYVYNSKIWQGRLRAEAWIDIERLRTLSPNSLNTIETGGGLEISTGLDADYDGKAGLHNGRSYVSGLLNLRPDHLAVFVNGDKGACSMNDGCGINNSISKGTNRNTGDHAMAKAKTDGQGDRVAVITNLVNERGFTAEELNAMDDATFALVSKAAGTQPINNTDPGEEETPETDGAAKTGCTCPKGGTVVNKVAPQQLSVEEWLIKSEAPEELKDMVRTVQNAANAEKDSLIANIDATKRLTLTSAQLAQIPVEDKITNGERVIGLRSLAELLAPQETEVKVPSYIGAAAGIANRRSTAKPEPMGMPSWDDYSAKN